MSRWDNCRHCRGPARPDDPGGVCGSCRVLDMFAGDVPLEPGPELERLREHARRHHLPDPGPGLDASAEEAWLDDLTARAEAAQAQGRILVVGRDFFERPRRKP